MSFQATSTSSFAQKRFSTIRLPSFRWSRLNASLSRGSVADTSLIGIVTRPKLMEPFHSARGGMALLLCGRRDLRSDAFDLLQVILERRQGLVDPRLQI